MRKIVSWSFLGNIIYAISQFLILSVLTYSGDYVLVGQYGLALAITTPVIKLFNLQLNTILASDQKFEINFNSIFIIRIGTSIISLILILFANFLFFENTQKLFIIIFLVSISKVIESMSDIVYGGFQRKEMIKDVAISKILRGILSSLSFSTIYIYTDNIYFSLLSISICWISILLIRDLKKVIQRFNDLSVNKLFYKSLILTSFPLGMSGTIDVFNINIPRYYSQHFLTTEDLGYYTAVSYLMVVGGILIDSISVSFVPKLSKYYVKEEFIKFNEFKRKLNLIVLFIGVSGILVATIFGNFFLNLLFNIENEKMQDLLVLIMIGCFFWYFSSIYNVYLYSTKVYRNQLTIMIITCVATSICGVLFIKNLGLLGAGYTFITCMFIRATLTYIVFKKSYKIKGEKNNVTKKRDNAN